MTNDNDNNEGKMNIAIRGTGKESMRTVAALFGKSVDKFRTDIDDPIKLTPHMAVRAGSELTKVWRVDMVRRHARVGCASEVQHWVLEAAWAHPAWHSYMFSLRHLRPIDGVPPPHIYLEEATHEMAIWAMNPDVRRFPFIKQGGPTGVLEPANFAAQFIEPTDELAKDRVERALAEVCELKLSPDTDHIAEWARRFGGNMLKRAQP